MLVCEDVYASQNVLSQLYTHELIEVCMIVSGSGIHRVLDQEIHCKAGDMHIILPNTSHGYFLANEGDTLIAKQVFFAVSDWFDEEIAAQDGTRFCHGIFRDHAVIACTTLNSSA